MRVGNKKLLDLSQALDYLSPEQGEVKEECVKGNMYIYMRRTRASLKRPKIRIYANPTRRVGCYVLEGYCWRHRAEHARG